MLANVIVVAGLLVDIGETLVTRVRHILLVGAPRDTSVLEQINDGGDVAGDLDEVVVLHAEVVTADSSNIVGLRGVSDCIVV